MPNSLEHTIGVQPYIEEVKPIYSYENWVEDVVFHTKNYAENKPYFEGIENNIVNLPITTILLVFLFALLAFLYSFHRKRLSLLLRTFFNWKVAKQVIRYERVYSHPANILLFITFLISTALFYAIAYQTDNYTETSIFQLSFTIIVFIISYLGIKLFLYKISAWIFKLNNIIEEYIFQSNLFIKIFGVINLMLTTLLLFSPINKLIIIGFSLSTLLIFLSIQLTRGILIGSQKAISMHLIILYLCTLEILPWLVIGKWIKNIL